MVSVPNIAGSLWWFLWSGPNHFWATWWPSLQKNRATFFAFLPLGLVAGSVVVVQGLRLATDSLASAAADGIPLDPEAATRVRQFLSHLEGPWHALWGPAAISQIATWLAVYRLFVGLLGSYCMLAACSWIMMGPVHAILCGAVRGGTRKRLRSHGSARWGTPNDAHERGNLCKRDDPSGLMLGRFPEIGRLKEDFDDKFVAHTHVITAAPSREGKNVGAATPAALTYPGSMFIFDPKAEIYAVTHRQRKKMGQRIAVIDPFGLTGRATHAVNWLSSIDVAHDSCISEAGTIAQALIPCGKGEESFWDDQARYLLQGLMLYIASLPPGQAHVGTLRHFLTMGAAKFSQFCERVKTDAPNLAHGVVRRMADAYLGTEVRERSGVLSTARRHTNFLDDPRIVSTLCRNDFHFGDLKSESKPVTVYVVVPPDKIKTYDRYLRATLNFALENVSRALPLQPENPVLFLLDEVAQLGYCSEIEKKISIIQGYGVLFWLFCQNLSQLMVNYPDWNTMVGNAYLQLFGIRDLKTAEYISNKLGQETIEVESSSQSSSTTQRSSSTGQSASSNAIARRLATPDEIMTMDKSELLVFADSQPPQKLKRLNYLRETKLAALADPNPFYASNAVTGQNHAPAAG